MRHAASRCVSLSRCSTFARMSQNSGTGSMLWRMGNRSCVGIRTTQRSTGSTSPLGLCVSVVASGAACFAFWREAQQRGREGRGRCGRLAGGSLGGGRRVGGVDGFGLDEATITIIAGGRLVVPFGAKYRWVPARLARGDPCGFRWWGSFALEAHDFPVGILCRLGRLGACRLGGIFGT